MEDITKAIKVMNFVTDDCHNFICDNCPLDDKQNHKGCLYSPMFKKFLKF
jgi:hypothetical protein